MYATASAVAIKFDLGAISNYLHEPSYKKFERNMFDVASFLY